MQKQKFQSKFNDTLLQIADTTAKEIYKQILFVGVTINVDINVILKDCKNDYNLFYEIIAMYYNDYYTPTGGLN